MLSYLFKKIILSSLGISSLILVLILLSQNYAANAKSKNVSDIVSVPSSIETEIKLEDINIGNKYLFEQSGKASHYAKRFHKRKTASGERFDMYDYTAAHRTLPFGTILKVTNTTNNQSTLLRINDRGPFVRTRILDLSLKSAKSLDAPGTPMIDIAGFIPGGNNPDYSDDIYYYSYSLEYEPLCIPAFAVHLIDSAYDFQKAVVNYKSMFPDFTGDKKLFLLVRADRYDSNAVEKYYLGYFDGKRKASQGIVAEKQ